MELRRVLILLALAGAVTLPARSRSSRPSNADQVHRLQGSESDVLKTRLDRIVRQQEQGLGQHVGAVFMSLKADSLVYAHRALNPMVPASNQKLLTVAAAWSDWSETLVAEMRKPENQRGVRRQRVRAVPRKGRRVQSGGESEPDSASEAFPERDGVTGLPGYDLLCRINKFSDNRLANRLAVCVARRQSEPGQAVVERYLDSLGLWAGGLNVVDGSGRSARNRVTALTLVQVLRAMRHGKRSEAFLASLPRSGVDGTLRRHPLGRTGRVAAKTGSIGGTYALSGYLLARSDTIAFALLLNRCYDKNSAFRFFGAMLGRVDRAFGS